MTTPDDVLAELTARQDEIGELPERAQRQIALHVCAGDYTAALAVLNTPRPDRPLDLPRPPGGTMSPTLTRIRTLLHAAPTWLTLAALVVTIFADELAAVLPTSAAETVGVWAARLVAWLTAATLIVRRVTPVLASERGLIPAPPAHAPNEGDAYIHHDLAGGWTARAEIEGTPRRSVLDDEER